MIKKKLFFLSIGSNLGDKFANIKTALRFLDSKVGQIKSMSSIYETKSLGFDGPDFFNLCVSIETEFSPKKLLDKLLKIEILMGRIRTDQRKLISRKIDMDILFYDNEIILSKKLQIPHPRLQNRNFVLYPMIEIAPNLEHPVLKIKISTIFKKSSDKSIPIKLSIKAS